MALVADWQLAHRPLYRPDEWPVAVWMAGLAAFAPLSDDPEKYFDAIRRNGEAGAWQPGPRPFHADDHAITQSYFLLHRVAHDRRMIAPALRLFEEMLRRPFDEPLDFHPEKRAREWVWCDALFMSPPALALATDATGDRRYVDLMSRLWWKTTDYLYDREERLYYRDSRFFDRREGNGKKVFWSRGNGWALAGLARVLQYVPADYPERPRFAALFQEMAEKVASLQGPDGYWPTGLLDPASHPAPETSGTALFTYALGWGVNEGLLESAAHESAVRKGWSALVRAVRPSGRLGYVQPVGDGPGEAGPERTEVYGAGAFLLAGSEVYRLAQQLRGSGP
jgi:rhamnogalacturonyl hydrolase YesR